MYPMRSNKVYTRHSEAMVVHAAFLPLVLCWNARGHGMKVRPTINLTLIDIPLCIMWHTHHVHQNIFPLQHAEMQAGMAHRFQGSAHANLPHCFLFAGRQAREVQGEVGSKDSQQQQEQQQPTLPCTGVCVCVCVCVCVHVRVRVRVRVRVCDIIKCGFFSILSHSNATPCLTHHPANQTSVGFLRYRDFYLMLCA